MANARAFAAERATGGGLQLYFGRLLGVSFFDPGGTPVPQTEGETPTGWFAEWFNGSGEADIIRVFVVCASP